MIKKLDLFILKRFMLPFMGILIVVTFIFVMQFLWLYIDDLVGKGLGMSIILEFLAWGCATLLPLCIPLATLLASVMTIGQIAENNELVAMRAAGISTLRIFAPLIMVSVVISTGAFFAGNNLSTTAFNKLFTLQDDFSKTKAEINIPTGTFYNGIENIALRIQSKDRKTNMMKGVMVYDHSDYKGNTSFTMADSARIKISEDKQYLTFTLYHGVNYQETNKYDYNDTTLQMQKIAFDVQNIVIPLQNYSFHKSDTVKYSDQVKSMNIKQLKHSLDSLKRKLDTLMANQMQTYKNPSYLRYYSSQIDTASHFVPKEQFDFDKMNKWDDIRKERMYLQYAADKLMSFGIQASTYNMETYEYAYILRRAVVEFLKKFASAIFCLILFFIGAPIGTFVRRGGLGTATIGAAFFFVLYWVVDISLTKLANNGSVKPVIGVFFSSVLFAIMGCYLTYKAIKESSPINTDTVKYLWKKFKTKIRTMFRKTRIVYMGTPEFAVAPLDELIKNGYDVAAVVTAADKPSGRGLKVNESAVKKYAMEHGIPVLQPLKLKDPDFLAALAKLKADLFVVVAFRMLPEEVWKMPPLGTFNLHAALLPQYRGAAPINWAIINGERISGVTTFMIDKDIDTGGIILRQECAIGENDTAGDLHDRLMSAGTKIVLDTVEGVIEKNVETRTQRSFIQGSEILKKAPKLTKELCHIDWNDSTKNIYNLIRGLSPYPAAFTNIMRGEEIVQMKIFNAAKSDKKYDKPAGSIITDNKTFIHVVTNDGAISLTDIQLSGKKRMDVKTFLLGFRNLGEYIADEGTSKAEIEKTKAQ